MTVGIYIRVSTEEQAKEGYSIPAQKERLTQFSASQGWNDIRFYIDEGVSAKDMNRPELQLLLEHAKGGQINTLLVYRLDRLTRSVRDLYNLLELLDKYNCSFKSATEQYDTTNAMGRMFIGLVALLAQWERENISERVKMALDEMVVQGKHVSGIPFGFQINKNGEKEPKEEEVKIIFMMIDKLKSGMSVNQIAKYLTVYTGTKWHHNSVLRTLRNPVICGDTLWVGKLVKNTHQGIISKKEYQKIQEILDANSQHRKREVVSTYLFQGVLICPHCNNPLSVNRYVRTKKDGTQTQGALYKCQNCWKMGRTMLSVGENRFLDALYKYMENIEIKDVEPLKEKDDTAITKKQLEQIERKREKYQRAWASDKMTDEEFDKLMDETREVYEELKKKINEVETPTQTITKEDIEKIVFSFNENFRLLTIDEKKEFVSRFFRKIEFYLEPQPPQRPDRAKKGKELVIISNIEFY